MRICTPIISVYLDALSSMTCMVTPTTPSSLLSACVSQTLDNVYGYCAANTTYQPTVSDNCNGTHLIQTGGPAINGTLKVGTNALSFSVRDAAGNTNQCSMTVHVLDTQAPSIGVPLDLISWNWI